MQTDIHILIRIKSKFTSGTPTFWLFLKHAKHNLAQGLCTCYFHCLTCSPQLPPISLPVFTAQLLSLTPEAEQVAQVPKPPHSSRVTLTITVGKSCSPVKGL